MSVYPRSSQSSGVGGGVQHASVHTLAIRRSTGQVDNEPRAIEIGRRAIDPFPGQFHKFANWLGGLGSPTPS